MHAEELVRHNAFLRRLATSLLRGEQDVDDVVQEAYLRALRHRPTRPRAWLGKVVRNLAFRSHRTGVRVARRERAAARSEALPSTAEDIERLEVQRQVVEAVLGLDEPYRSVVIRRYLDELSPREISLRSGVPYETVRTRLGRALRELRRRLDTEHASWAPVLALLVLRSSKLSVLGGVVMSAKSKTLVASLAILGVGVGVAGHAAFTGSGEGRVARDPGPVRGGSLPSEVASLRAEVASLKRELESLRSGTGEAGEANQEPSGGVDACMSESVVATIEVKSTLDPLGIENAARAACKVKRLDRNLEGLIARGTTPPGILSFVVAYEGPASMDTVQKWIGPIHKSLGVDYPEDFHAKSSPSLEGVFVLGRGFILYNNLPIGFVPKDKWGPRTRWTVSNVQHGSLLLLFLLLTIASSGTVSALPNVGNYVADWRLPEVWLAEYGAEEKCLCPAVPSAVDRRAGAAGVAGHTVASRVRRRRRKGVS